MTQCCWIRYSEWCVSNAYLLFRIKSDINHTRLDQVEKKCLRGKKKNRENKKYDTSVAFKINTLKNRFFLNFEQTSRKMHTHKNVSLKVNHTQAYTKYTHTHTHIDYLHSLAYKHTHIHRLAIQTVTDRTRFHFPSSRVYKEGKKIVLF